MKNTTSGRRYQFHSRYLKLITSIFIFSTFISSVIAQGNVTVTEKPIAPAILPGNGVSHFNFFYAGEAKSRNMYIVRDGEIT